MYRYTSVLHQKSRTTQESYLPQDNNDPNLVPRILSCSISPKLGNKMPDNRNDNNPKSKINQEQFTIHIHAKNTKREK
jgi:hypothetical protein